MVGITVQAADLGDTTTLGKTLEAAEAAAETVVADKGDHSGAAVQGLAENGQEAVIPEPERKWKEGQEDERAAVE